MGVPFWQICVDRRRTRLLLTFLASTCMKARACLVGRSPTSATCGGRSGFTPIPKLVLAARNLAAPIRLQYPWRSCKIHIYAYAKHITTHQLQLAYAWPKNQGKNFVGWRIAGVSLHVARATGRGHGQGVSRREGCVCCTANWIWKEPACAVLCVPTCSIRYL